MNELNKESSEYIPIGSGSRNDANKVMNITVGEINYSVPFDHITSLTFQMLSQGLLTGLLSWDYFQQILEQHKGVKGKNLMYSPDPLFASLANQQLYL